MEETMEIEGPHKVLLLEDTLQRIFSFLGENSRKEARLVCHKWNDNVLANFHRKMKLAIKQWPRVDNTDVSEIISSADHRILSNIHIKTGFRGCPDDILQITLARCQPFQALRGLHLEMLYERDLDFLVEVINTGELRSLEDLTLLNVFNDGQEGSHKCVNVVSPDALPNLWKFMAQAHFAFCDEEVNRFRRENLAVLLQSFVSAARKFTNVHCNIPLDLAGKSVNKLAIDNHRIVKEEEALQMMNMVQSSLSWLCLYNIFPQVNFKDFQKLTTLNLYLEEERGRIPPLGIDDLISLKNVDVPYYCAPWDKFPKILPPTASLKELKIWQFPVPDNANDPATLEIFQRLLNLRLNSLKLKFNRWVEIPQLKSILQAMELSHAEGRESARLELYLVHIERNTTESEIQDLTSILESLGNNWSQIRLAKYEVIPTVNELGQLSNKEPTWSEHEVPLFGGQKKGMIKRYVDSSSVMLQMKK